MQGSNPAISASLALITLWQCLARSRGDCAAIDEAPAMSPGARPHGTAGRWAVAQQRLRRRQGVPRAPSPPVSEGYGSKRAPLDMRPPPMCVCVCRFVANRQTTLLDLRSWASCNCSAGGCHTKYQMLEGPCGLMDKALVFGTKDCRFESCQGHAPLPARERMRAPSLFAHADSRTRPSYKRLAQGAHVCCGPGRRRGRGGCAAQNSWGS